MPSHEVRGHYERHPYPHYPLISSVRRRDTYALNLQALWARFNGVFLPPQEGRILIAGSGSFAPYTMSVANPRTQVTALDLAGSNLCRARLHCLLHGRRNVRFLQGDLLDLKAAPGPFHFIDSFGVLHHLDDPAAGLHALECRLSPGGILRVMVYGRYARREAESIRRGVKLLGIDNISKLKQLFARAKPESRIRSYLDNSWEARSDSGLADLFLHPRVHTYRIDEFLAMVSQSRLQPLLFAHARALSDPPAEIERLRELDRRKETPTNIICYLGLDTRGPCPPDGNALLCLNPCLDTTVSTFHPCPVEIAPRLGFENPPLDFAARRFLRRFRTAAPASIFSEDELLIARSYLDALFMMACRAE
jgi:2-polyprenyl-3-methyl-5-hydroxy-6-metoxy-1,4-benzoquinol methylase